MESYDRDNQQMLRQYTDPVSYTHLDVYKRQEHTPCLRRDVKMMMNWRYKCSFIILRFPPVVLYGSETWITTKVNEQAFRTRETKFFRRIKMIFERGQSLSLIHILTLFNWLHYIKK